MRSMRTAEENAGCKLDEVPNRLCPPFQEAFKPYLKMTRNMAKCGDGDAGGFGGGAGLGDGGGARFKAMLKRAPKVGADAAWHAHDEPVLKVRCAQRRGVGWARGEGLGSRGVAASCSVHARREGARKDRPTASASLRHSQSLRCRCRGGRGRGRGRYRGGRCRGGRCRGGRCRCRCRGRGSRRSLLC